MKHHTYYTIPSWRGTDGELQPFQCLHIGARKKYIAAYSPGQLFAPATTDITLQRFDVFRTASETDLHVLAVQEPEVLSMSAFTYGHGISLRDLIREWTSSSSCFAGCVRLVDPVAVRATCPLDSKQVPVLALTDELALRECEGVARLVLHRPSEGHTIYDNRKVASKREYLKCVLSQADIWKKGVTEFPSNSTAAWYRLLLASPDPIEAGLSAKECRLRLRILAGKTTMPIESAKRLKRSSPDGPAAPSRQACQDIDGGSDGGDNAGSLKHTGPEASLTVKPPRPKKTESATERSESTSSSESSSSTSTKKGPSSSLSGSESGQESASDRGDWEVPHLPDSICGVAPDVRIAKGKYVSWRVRCPNSAHGRCELFRSVRLDREFGKRGCEAYLAVWLQAAFSCDGAQHEAMKSRIAPEAMGEYLGQD